MKVLGKVTKIVEGISKDKIFNIWSDINNWHKFNHGIISAELHGEFKEGNHFVLFLKNNKKVKIQIFKIEKNKSFTDVTSLPFAKIYGIHEMIEKDDKLEISASVEIEGALSFLWERIVGKKIVDKLEDDMMSLIGLAKND
ncbi:MAG: hypothetical protein ACNI3C_06350 [Candidatus Marinarcus sp.]|uniref:hypothetical protein n=1 Tax=Candidatus Marinarcus sp. TaxID=3100987 RepID=UPI003B003485